MSENYNGGWLEGSGAGVFGTRLRTDQLFPLKKESPVPASCPAELSSPTVRVGSGKSDELTAESRPVGFINKYSAEARHHYLRQHLAQFECKFLELSKHVDRVLAGQPARGIAQDPAAFFRITYSLHKDSIFGVHALVERLNRCVGIGYG
jgi:hypothetical protein